MVLREAPHHPIRETMSTKGLPRRKARSGTQGKRQSQWQGGASEGTNPCTRPSFATKNVFDVLQDLSESIGGSPGPQLDAADGQPEPIVHDLHQSLVELLERPDILSLHAVRRVGRERQLHLKVRALCGEVEKVFDVLVDTGAQVSLVKAGLLPPECLTDSRRPVRLKVANGRYMVGGTREAAIGLQFVNHRELSRPDLGKEILLQVVPPLECSIGGNGSTSNPDADPSASSTRSPGRSSTSHRPEDGRRFLKRTHPGPDP